MIVTLDGPAGAGKSTVAKALAERLGFRFLDTGAMYRAIAVACLRAGVAWRDEAELVRIARSTRIEFDSDRVLLDGQDVTDAIRDGEISTVIRHVADQPEIRAHLVAQQRRIGRAGDIVSEGRDQGTVVFPDAQCKIFLTATPEERARRRIGQLRARGEETSIEEVLREQQRRDREDASRPVGPLRQADDAIEVLTDGMDFNEVLDELEQLVNRRRKP